MRYSLLIAFCILSLSSFAQEDNVARDSILAYLKKVFSKVPASKYAELVPYYSNKKWGYIDRINKKIMVKPIFDNPEFFNPDIRTYFGDEMINISGSGYVFIEKEDYNNQNFSEVAPAGNESDTKVRSSKNGFKGFTTTSSGELLTYSDLYQYDKQGIPGWNIQIINYQSRYYGIVTNMKGKAGIIDSDGVPLKGFDFNYHEIKPNRYTKDTANAWVFVKENENENFSLMSTKGEIKFRNEFFTYPLTSEDMFGYIPYRKGDTVSIFDRYNMEWIIKPQTKIKVGSLFFSSKTNLTIDMPKDRDHAYVYYLVSEGEKKYIVDMNGIKYLPKK
jgi:hypothetical protein